MEPEFTAEQIATGVHAKIQAGYKAKERYWNLLQQTRMGLQILESDKTCEHKEFLEKILRDAKDEFYTMYTELRYQYP